MIYSYEYCFVHIQEREDNTVILPIQHFFFYEVEEILKYHNKKSIKSINRIVLKCYILLKKTGQYQKIFEL